MKFLCCLMRILICYLFSHLISLYILFSSFTVDVGSKFHDIQSIIHEEVDFKNEIGKGLSIETKPQQEENIHSNKNIEMSSKSCNSVILPEHDNIKQLSCKISEDLIFDIDDEEMFCKRKFPDICVSITVANDMSTCPESSQPRAVSLVLSTCQKK